MKKKKAIISAFLAVVLSACAVGCSMTNENVVENTISLESVDQLSANLSSINLSIELGEKNSIHYRVYESLEPTVSEKNGTLNIKSKKGKKSGFFSSSNDNYIEITLNKKQLDDIDISLSSGNVELKDLNVSGKIKTSSGNIKINNVEKGNELFIEASSGNIDINKCSINKLENKSSSGNIELNGIKANNIIIDTSSGNASISDTDICDINAESGSGNIVLDLNGKEIECNCDLSVSSGKIKVDGNSYKDKYTQNNNAKNTIKCRTSSGNIKVRFD